MDLPSPSLTDKYGVLSRNDSSVHKEKEDPSSVSTDVNDTQDLMVQRCVIIQKDEKGYGLTVSGDNPVFVQSVKEDGAAARAGVQQGDRIIKVNGTLVTQSNHQDVVELIKSGSYVALTLLGKPPGQSKGTLSPTQSFHLPGKNSSMSISNSNKSGSSNRITGPQPVDPEKQQQLTNSRIHTIRKMLEKEADYLENLRAEFSKTPSEEIRSKVNGAMKRVKTLEEQLFNLTGIPHEHIVTRSPKSPTSGRHSHDKENHRSVSFPAPGFHNRALTHQTSAPALPANQEPHIFSLSPDSDDPKQSATLLPCHESRDQNQSGHSPDMQKQSISTSLENLVKHMNPRTTTWPQPTHTRQSSSPETLIDGLESFKCQKSNGCTIPRADSLHRSPSAVSPSYGGYKNISSESDSRNSHPANTSRGSSIGQYDSAVESPIPSPPVTPPEPAESHQFGADSFEGDDAVPHEEYGTPPESTLGEISLHSVVSKLSQNPNIICMEDEEFSSDPEMSHVDDHGPFSGLWKLVRNPAHLSVFLHYLMSNSDPSSLFFYLISDMYEQGSGRDMKKWAYEIHSSFLVPGAPLKVSSVDETILHEIDEVLQNHIDKEEILRNVFKKANRKAKEELNDFLADFRNKRTMGLANMYGPPDYQLEEAKHDKNKELKIIEQLLVPCLEPSPEDLEGVDDRAAAKTYALATVLKHFGVKSPQALAQIDRCPMFVGKGKSRLRILPKSKKDVMFMQGHHFVSQHYYSVTYCNHCQLIIWGVGYQGYQCQNCEMNIHKSCVKVVEEHCIGAVRKRDIAKDKKEKAKERHKKDRKSGIMENIIGKTRKPSQPIPAAIEKAKKLNDEMNAENALHAAMEANQVKSSEAGDRMVDDLREPSDIVFQNMLNLSESAEKPNVYSNKKNASTIGRSESFRQRRESKPPFRKRSDPNIPRSKSDVDVDEKNSSALNESRSSSNSSLSNSLDSPSNSSEMVHRTPTSVSADSVPANFAPSSGITSSSGHSTGTMHTYDDSDLEAEADPPNWQENVDWDVLKVMKPKEKKRQDVINELFHTERTHVRNLKVLDRLFYKPMLQEQLLPPDFLNLLFPNLEEMLEIHVTFNNKMKARRKMEPVIGDIGQLMLEMFDGAAGEHLKQAAARYCQNQSIALESLKIRQKKDQKLAQSLSDAEVNNLCRRLQLKDIIASGFQRLTKYPLLLENIAKYTPPNTQELSDLQRAVECSKEILVHVDSAIKEAENMHRLLDIQKKMEKSSFEKVEHPIVHSFKNLDVTKHKLLHEGPLTWRLNKQKTVEMHVVLMEDILILFQKQDEKYILKFHNTNLTSGREDTKIMHSPILRVHNLLIRNNATDKRSIFLISSSEMHAMYEFVAATASEKKIWCQHLTKAVEQQTQSGNLLKNNQEPAPVVSDTVVASSDEQQDDTDVESKEVESSSDVQQDSKETGPDAVKPDSSVDVAQTSIDPEASASATDLDDIPQKAKQIGVDDETSDSEKEPKSPKRFQRVDVLQVTEGPQLIEPSEVIVSSGAICETAEPVFTPIERLRRKDLEIVKAIREKEKILADIFQVTEEELTIPPEISADAKDATSSELIMVAVQQANKLTSLINEGLNFAEETPAIETNALSVEESASSISVSPVSPDKFNSLNYFCRLQGISHRNILPISTSLNCCLVQLMAMMQDIEEERRQLRKELANYREQIHHLHETHRHCVVPSQSPSTYSRPSSFVSVASTTSDGIAEFFEHQQLFSVLENSEEASAGDTDIIPKDTSADLQSSSPINENIMPSESWTLSEANESESRTCDQSMSVSNCDDTNSPTVVAADSCTIETSRDLPSISESDSISRTVQETANVDPVYL
ncbi:Rho guanine nucleotide exchange factor 11, partial [Stegodyphus mimosarum]